MASLSGSGDSDGRGSKGDGGGDDNGIGGSKRRQRQLMWKRQWWVFVFFVLVDGLVGVFVRFVRLFIFM